MSRFAIGISHSPQDPKRVTSLKRLFEVTGPVDHVEDRPAPKYIWPRRLWGAIWRTQAEQMIFLQDDVIATPLFRSHVDNIARRWPDNIVCFHTPHWRFAEQYAIGHTSAISHDGLVGNGYMLSRNMTRRFLKFYYTDLRREARQQYNEDSQIALFAMAQKIPIIHPMPSIIDHDTSITSTWGADEHLYRRPQAVGEPGNWQHSDPVDIGLIYEREHWRLLTHLTPEAVKSYDAVQTAYDLDRLRNPRMAQATLST